MCRQTHTKTPEARRHSYLWLALATVLLVFGNGRWIVPIAAWFAPVFMLRFLRSQPTRLALPLGYLAHFVAAMIVWQGMIPLPLHLYVPISFANGFVFFLPFVIERLLARRLKGFSSTLVLPLAWVTVEFVAYSANPVGQWGQLAYTQARNLSLLQLVSVTGIWGIGFLMAWFASTFNWAWERGFDWGEIRRGAAIYVGLLASVLLFGEARMTFFRPDSTTVRIASITVSPKESTRSFFSMATDESHEDLRRNRGEVQRIQDELLKLTRREALAGAKMVFWAEANAVVHAEHEEAFVERGRELAREDEIFLLMPLYVVHPGGQAPENKVLTIDPDGEIRSTYHKTKVAVEASLPGDGFMPTLETPYGKITSAICVDFSYPDHIRQVGRADVDIALDPSWDWKAIDPYHTWVSAVRAVENGFSLVRHTNDGLSATVDYLGNVLASMDHFTTNEPVMVSEVPIQGVTTIYSRIGDSFAWLCLAGLAMIAGSGIVLRRSTTVG